jgi:hypothetical protein
MTNRRDRQIDQHRARARLDAQFEDEFGYQRQRVSWHLEKGVSISIIVVLLAQAASGVWFASKMTAQVEQNTNDIMAIKADEKEREKQRAEVIANLSSINQELRDMREIMFQSAGRPTQLVMPASSNGAPPTINIQQAPTPAPQQLPGIN